MVLPFFGSLPHCLFFFANERILSLRLKQFENNAQVQLCQKKKEKKNVFTGRFFRGRVKTKLPRLRSSRFTTRPETVRHLTYVPWECLQSSRKPLSSGRNGVAIVCAGRRACSKQLVAGCCARWTAVGLSLHLRRRHHFGRRRLGHRLRSECFTERQSTRRVLQQFLDGSFL